MNLEQADLRRKVWSSVFRGKNVMTKWEQMTYSENSAKNLARIDWPMNDVLFDVPLHKSLWMPFAFFWHFVVKAPVKWECSQHCGRPKSSWTREVGCIQALCDPAARWDRPFRQTFREIVSLAVCFRGAFAASLAFLFPYFFPRNWSWISNLTTLTLFSCLSCAAWGV